MRLDNNRLGETGVVLGDIQESTEFQINLQSQPIIIDSLINLYEDPIGSIVREITSNCVDAHKEKDLKAVGRRPLEDDDDVQYFSKRNTIEIEYVDKNDITNNLGAFIFRDFGVGLSENRIREIFTVFGSSTKRGDNEEIGGFGLGSKSPFAYTDTFFVRSVRNRIKTTYMMSRGQVLPTMDKINVEETTQDNGTEVVIPIKERYQARDFVSAINRQLTYFPELVFINVDSVGSIQKSSIVFETPDFILDKKSNHAGILIGNVEYPLNEDLLDTKIPRCGVKYKFDVGVLDLVPSREAIRYTETTKAKIEAKIKNVDDFAKNKISEDIENETNFKSKLVKTMIANEGGYRHYRSQENEIINEYFSMLCSIASSKFNLDFKYDTLVIPSDRLNLSWVFRCFETVYLRYNSKTLKRGGVSYPDIYSKNSHIYLKGETDVHTRKKDLYLFNVKHLNDSNNIYVCKEIAFDTSRMERDGVDKEAIDELKTQQKQIIALVKAHLTPFKYGEIAEYDEKISRTNYTALRKANSKIFYREYQAPNRRGWGHSEEWGNSEDTILDLDTEKTIFGFEDDKDKLELAKKIYRSFKLIRVAKTTKNLFQKGRYVGDLIKEGAPDIANFVNKMYLQHVVKQYAQLEEFADIDLDIYNKYIVLKDINLADLTVSNNEADLDKVLALIHVNKEFLINPDYVTKVKELKEFMGAFPLFPYLGLKSGNSPLHIKEFRIALKEYINLKRATINNNQTKL